MTPRLVSLEDDGTQGRLGGSVSEASDPVSAQVVISESCVRAPRGALPSAWGQLEIVTLCVPLLVPLAPVSSPLSKQTTRPHRHPRGGQSSATGPGMPGGPGSREQQDGPSPGACRGSTAPPQPDVRLRAPECRRMSGLGAPRSRFLHTAAEDSRRCAPVTG